MRPSIVSSAVLAAVAVVCGAVGVASGWLLHAPPAPAAATRIALAPPKPLGLPPTNSTPTVKPTPPKAAPAPEKKPISGPPKPDPKTMPTAMPPPSGSLAPLPSGPLGLGPLKALPSPSLATGVVAPPTADLKADEARLKRLVVGRGAEITSSSDAKDSIGKVGRRFEIECSAEVAGPLQTDLHRVFGDRLIVSDAGLATTDSAPLRDQAKALDTLRKQRDQARLDFLPNAPALLDLEDQYTKAEQALDATRKTVARRRIDLLLRPGAGA